MFNNDNINEILGQFSSSFKVIKSIESKSFNSKDLAGFIDHTLLKPDASLDEVKILCSEAKEFGFASVCLNPAFVNLASEILSGSKVKVCTVIGFPLGASTTQTKIFETKDAIDKGATEIDMVLNISRLKNDEQNYVLDEIASITEIAHTNNAISKVIIETCLLSDSEKVKACLISKKAKADFVKTSTGFSKGGATVEDVALMKFTVGGEVQVKASGGIRTYEDAMIMIANGATRLGASAGVKIISGLSGDSNY